MSKINIIFLSQTFYHGLLRDPKWSRSPLLHSHWQPLSHSRLLTRFSNTQISFPSQGFCLLGVASKFLISAAQISPTQKGLSQWQLTYKRPPPHTHPNYFPWHHPILLIRLTTIFTILSLFFMCLLSVVRP